MDTDSIIGSPWPTAEGLWVVWFPFTSSSPSASSVAVSFRSVEVETNKAATGSIRAKWVIEQQETDSGEIISGVLDAAEPVGSSQMWSWAAWKNTSSPEKFFGEDEGKYVQMETREWAMPLFYLRRGNWRVSPLPLHRLRLPQTPLTWKYREISTSAAARIRLITSTALRTRRRVCLKLQLWFQLNANMLTR